MVDHSQNFPENHPVLDKSLKGPEMITEFFEAGMYNEGFRDKLYEALALTIEQEDVDVFYSALRNPKKRDELFAALESHGYEKAPGRGITSVYVDDMDADILMSIKDGEERIDIVIPRKDGHEELTPWARDLLSV